MGSYHYRMKLPVSIILLSVLFFLQKIDTVDGAPKPLDEINLHFHLNDLENDNKKEDSYKGRDYGDRVTLQHACRNVRCSGKRTSISIQCCAFGDDRRRRK